MLTPKTSMYTVGLREQRNSVLNDVAYSRAILERGNRGFGRAAIPAGTILSYMLCSVVHWDPDFFQQRSVCLWSHLSCCPLPMLCLRCSAQLGRQGTPWCWDGIEVLKLRGCPSPAAFHNTQMAVASSKFSGGFTSTHEIFWWTPS